MLCLSVCILVCISVWVKFISMTNFAYVKDRKSLSLLSLAWPSLSLCCARSLSLDWEFFRCAFPSVDFASTWSFSHMIFLSTHASWFVVVSRRLWSFFACLFYALPDSFLVASMPIWSATGSGAFRVIPQTSKARDGDGKMGERGEEACCDNRSAVRCKINTRTIDEEGDRWWSFWDIHISFFIRKEEKLE